MIYLYHWWRYWRQLECVAMQELVINLLLQHLCWMDCNKFYWQLLQPYLKYGGCYVKCCLRCCGSLSMKFFESMMYQWQDMSYLSWNYNHASFGEPCSKFDLIHQRLLWKKVFTRKLSWLHKWKRNCRLNDWYLYHWNVNQNWWKNKTLNLYMYIGSNEIIIGIIQIYYAIFIISRWNRITTLPLYSPTFVTITLCTR